MSSTPTDKEIETVTRNAVKAFRSLGLSACLFGGAACRMYGNSRTPNDVDLVVMTSKYTTEELKAMLARKNPSFYLRASRKPGETYKIVFYKLRGNLNYSRRSCKVDILIPGVLNIPVIAPSDIMTPRDDGDLPCMPIIPLLLLKLQGWADHRDSTRTDMIEKQYVDIRDISQLLQIAIQSGAKLADVEGSLPAEFVDAGRKRLARYMVTVRPTQRWTEIGF